MGRDAYENRMKQRLSDLGIQIASVSARLADSPDDRLRMDFAAQLATLEGRRAAIGEMLVTLGDEPDGTWEDLRLQIEDHWDALIQDFEERLASLV